MDYYPKGQFCLRALRHDTNAVNLKQEGLESFPGTEDFAPASFEAGWKGLIGNLLKNFLAQKKS